MAVIETFDSQCPACGKNIRVEWENGFIPNPNSVLIADWVFHTECWDIETDNIPQVEDEGGAAGYESWNPKEWA